MSSTLLFVNLKGGVAKTTNAVAVAECMADQGYRTLLIDADHQCMAGELLLGESRMLHSERRKKTLHDLLSAMLDDEFAVDQIDYYIEHGASNVGEGYENLSVLPCSIRIDDFQANMAKARRGYRSKDEFIATLRKRRTLMRRWLHENYDFTFVDCPPSLALQVHFLLGVADSFVIPCIPDRLSVRGSLYLLDRLRRSNFKKQGIGTLWSLYRQQNPIHRKVIEAATKSRKPYKELPAPFQTIIPNAAAIAESTEIGSRPHTFNAKYTSPFAKRYAELCREIIQRTQWHAEGKRPSRQAIAAGRALINR
jgi:chromosome partitioning protein